MATGCAKADAARGPGHGASAHSQDCRARDTAEQPARRALAALREGTTQADTTRCSTITTRIPSASMRTFAPGPSPPMSSTAPRWGQVPVEVER